MSLLEAGGCNFRARMLIFGYAVAQFGIKVVLLTFFDMIFTLAAGGPQR